MEAHVRRKGIQCFSTLSALSSSICRWTRSELTFVRHRFDLPKFYAEAHRVLRPGGTLAAWGYDLLRLNDEDADPYDSNLLCMLLRIMQCISAGAVGIADCERIRSMGTCKVLQHLCVTVSQHPLCICSVLEKLYGDTLGPYWDDRRRLIESHYEGERDLQFYCVAALALAALSVRGSPGFVLLAMASTIGIAAAIRNVVNMLRGRVQAWSRLHRLRTCGGGPSTRNTP